MASSSVKLIGAAFLREGPLPSSLVKERLFALVAGATAIIEAATRMTHPAQEPTSQRLENVATEDIGALEFGPLDPDRLAEIERILQRPSFERSCAGAVT